MHLATATAPGSAHINPGQPGKINNQDAIFVSENEHGCVAVLCDGCGSKPSSGLGANIGTRLIAQAIERQLKETAAPKKINWPQLIEEVLSAIRQMIKEVYDLEPGTPAFNELVVDQFLFTAMVLVVYDGVATVAAFGDGVVIADDEVQILQSPIPNTPPYLGYLLLSDDAYSAEMKPLLAFSVVKTVPLSDVKKTLIVGTDGLKDLVGEDIHHPALVQPLSLQRWLNMLTAEKIQKETFVPGKCSDDVTLVMIRSEEAQERLLKQRQEVIDLKKEITALRQKLEDKSGLLEQANRRAKRDDRRIEELEQSIAEAEQNLADAEEKAASREVLAEAVVEFLDWVNTLRGKPLKEAKHLARYVDKFVEKIRAELEPEEEEEEIELAEEEEMQSAEKEPVEVERAGNWPRSKGRNISRSENQAPIDDGTYIQFENKPKDHHAFRYQNGISGSLNERR